MSDRVDNELRRVSTALAEVSPPMPDLPRSAQARRRPPVLAAVASFVIVLGLGLVVGLLVGSDSDRVPTVASTLQTTSTIRAASTGPVPDDHLAARLLAEGAGFEEFAELSHHCARGGSNAGPHTTCLVDDQGMLVVVPLRMAADVEAVVRGSAFDGETRIELPTVRSEDSLPALEDLVAISHTGGSVEVELWHNGEAGAGMSSELPPPPGDSSAAGTIPVPADHVAREVVAADLSFNEVAVFALDRGTDPLCGEGGGAAVCVVWEDDVAVFIPYSLPEGITTEVSSPSLDGRLEVELEVGELLAVPHPAGRFTIIHRIPGEDGTRSYSSELGSSNGP